MSNLTLLDFKKKNKKAKTSNENGENVRERVEDALDMVDNGNGISNAIIVLVGNDGDIVDCFANHSSPFTVVGALESIKRDFMDQAIERRE